MAMLYQVVYTGALQPHVNAEQAARDFAAIFKVPDEKAWKLVLGKRAHVLKREVDEANANRYRDILEEIGLDVRVEPSGTPLDRAAADAADAADAVDALPGHDSPVLGSSPRSVAGTAAGSSAGAPGQPSAGAAARSAGANAPRRGPASPASEAGSERAEPDVNSYAPPAADLTVSAAGLVDDDPMTGPHTVPAGHGWEWIKLGFEIFKQSPLAWVGAFVVFSLISILLSLVPMLGGLLSSLLGPVLLGGLMLGAHAQSSGGYFRVGHLFEGFSGYAGRLLAVGGLYLLGIMVIAIVVGVIVGIAATAMTGIDPSTLDQQDPELMVATLGPVLLFALLLVMLFAVPLIMAYWFAPVLVVLEDMQPLAAMQLSFTACWRNIMAFLVYGLIAMVLLMVATIPFFLGLLIVSPILIASIYCAYRDIFYRGQPRSLPPI